MFARYRSILALLALLLVSGIASAATFNVTAGVGNSLTFTPSTLTIHVGDTVTWTNTPGGFHNVAANDGSFRNGSASSSAWTFSHTFTSAGTVGYHCEIHSGMTGSITVNAAAPTIALGGYLSGNWFIPTQGGGHGFQLEFTNAPGSAGKLQALAIWFVYTPAGSSAGDGSGQNWIYAQGDYDPAASTVTLPAVLLVGPRFPPNFNSADLHRVPNDTSLWGTLTFAFSGCNDGTVSWHSDVPGYNAENDTPLAMQRLTQIAGTTCPQ
jgi:plastocyanin